MRQVSNARVEIRLSVEGMIIKNNFRLKSELKFCLKFMSKTDTVNFIFK
jgi:hypothetical protein